MTALSDKKIEWQPSASIKNLLARAKIIADIRQFFTERGLLEVETPVLSEFGVTDLHLSTFNSQFLFKINTIFKHCRFSIEQPDNPISIRKLSYPSRTVLFIPYTGTKWLTYKTEFIQFQHLCVFVEFGAITNRIILIGDTNWRTANQQH